MENNKTNRSLKTRVLNSTFSFSTFSIIWLILLLITSLIEIIFNGITHGLSGQAAAMVTRAIINDLIYWLKSLAILYLIFAIVFLIKEKSARILYIVFIILSVLIQFFLIRYFNLSLLPLGADLFGYSVSDIRQTVGSSGAVSLSAIGLFILFAAITFSLLKWLPQKIRIPAIVAKLLPLLSILFVLTGIFRLVEQPALKTEFANNLVLNKSDYFFSSSYNYFYPSGYETDIYADNYIIDFVGKGGKSSSFRYVDESHFPFLHQDSTADVLSPFFTKPTTPPHIVILLVEGLGRAFTNEGAYLGNFTPFLDSLSGKSLYWKNCLSAGGRTFAVLPSLLGSLPFEKNGFLETGSQMPNTISLLNLLNFNGYQTSFYYGGDAEFDNMGMYLRKNHIDELEDIHSFPAGYTKLPAVNGFSWGYNDKELFRHYLTTRPDDTVPQLSVILTVATHNPFVINEEEKYLQRFEERMTQLSFNDSRKQEYRDYKLQYASILYTDDALKSFFETYKKRHDFNNTIFLITGDHRMPEIPMSDKIDRYHVPLIIYSSLLKRTAQISAVSSHFDITPSLLAFLEHSYQIKKPSLASWIGQGLDTSRNFQSINFYPMMQTKTDLLDFVMDEYHLNGEQLFKLSADLSELPVQDDDMKNKLKNAFDQFRKRNMKLIDGSGKLIPDTIINNYTKKRP
ncbi:uncharacterized sulfatase [Chitinophaga sp. CF118]|uniref:LTA synthase family protein n=1 Tax=Chitinophaga sp. CF118 TaxID=1884367 RepID=UPI0008E1D516|nr:LTA synthase family protein [Chitinophaga sp. CF118]SFD76221.1 uncharacterized sulfatase [Chitinophaga sp. CF118]